MKTCPECNGDGVIEKGTDDEQQCPTCCGSGFVPDYDDDDEEVTRTLFDYLVARPSNDMGKVTPRALAVWGAGEARFANDDSQ